MKVQLDIVAIPNGVAQLLLKKMWILLDPGIPMRPYGTDIREERYRDIDPPAQVK
ncbi:MAG: hypothetical protein KKG33_04510 [candidate division Zixibacteria bacterium]|nr:hypothetical protein [candidate division Zixibacteria bacterium]MBU1470287.1 hypothetical protein [candidate division Zixibacteria bacterium]MBU2624804.1 hypothetical protein [candidate division Zixibacteria bacterium]